MEKKDTYRTIAAVAEGYYREKGSKFTAYAYPVCTEEEVKEIVDGLKKEFYDARHHCYAYVLGFEGELWRANDDGEPSSTAGKPIHGQIVSRDLTNTLVVVVRYFGGTKLGVSGLINAYRTAAADALDNAEIVTRIIESVYAINFSYLAMNDVMRLVKDEELTIFSQNFDTACRMEVGIRQSKEEMVLDKISKIDSALTEFLRVE